MTRLLFVAAPNGFTATGLARIRVLVVPQLDGGPLRDYGLQDWPATLTGTTLRVRVKTAGRIRTAWSGPQHEPAARSEVWRAFFSGTAGIAAPWSATPAHPPDVVGTHDAAGAVLGTYRTSTNELAVAPPSAATAPGAAAAPAPGAGPALDPRAGAEARLRRRIVAWHEPVPDSAVPPRAASPPLPPSPDFHQAVALLREHPAVLRELGLVFELAVDPAALAEDSTVETEDSTKDGAARWLSVLPRSALPVPVTSPWSSYDLTPDAFWPAPAPESAGAMRHGVLNLSAAHVVAPADPDPGVVAAGPAPAWAIATFDVQGAVQGLRDTARSLAEDPDRTAALPGLRSAGLLLIRPDRQGDYRRRAASAGLRAAAPDDQHLTAEELTLGYRVDIRDGNESRWLPLCGRRVAYTVREPDSTDVLTLGGAPYVAEEGHVKPFAAVRQDGVLSADQVVLRWDGWSLVLPRVDLTGAAPASTRDPAVPLPYDFRWEYAHPGDDPAVDDRLPRLRFGTDYRLRVRLADVTGGGRPLADIEADEGASQAIVYTRHDPVRPPSLAGAQTSYAPGSAIDRLVLRSDEGLTAEAFVLREPRYAEDEIRTLYRPSVSFEVAQQHGVFDPPASDEHTWTLARRTLDPFGLPDPAANGVMAHLPKAPGGLAESVGDFSTWRPWPDSTPKSLVLKEETDPTRPRISAHWDLDQLVVRLAKGEQATLELSSRILPGMQDNFAWGEWLVEDHVPLADSMNGRNPVVTPPRVVEVVHAVRKPLAEPAWSLPAQAVTRPENATIAVLRPTFVSLDTDSTGRIEISASWPECDDGTTEVAGGIVHAQTLDRGDPPRPEIRHEFGDTRHRTVAYSIRAISRYRHYFHDDEPDAAFVRVRAQPDAVNILSSARPSAPEVVGTVPSFHWHTEVRPGIVERVRSARIRVELARPWYRSGEGERLAVVAAVQDPPATTAQPGESELSRDPIVATGAPPRFPRAASFSAAAGPPVRVTAVEWERLVDVVPYEVHPAEDHWFADVAIVMSADSAVKSTSSDASSYRPFVRLGVARFQPDSLPGLSLSPIVATELVPLLPDRRLTVERGDGNVLVTVTGPGPNPPNTVEITVETCDAPVEPQLVDLVQLPGGGNDDRVPVWRATTPAPITVAVGATATVAVPTGPAQVRLRIREVDPIEAAGGSPDPRELTDRTVFFDVVQVPPAWLPAPR
jgi:hypothetical protein